MKKLLLIFALLLGLMSFGATGFAKGKAIKSKFYDFSEQLIDGEIKKPKVLYTEVRQKVKFGKLLKLQKHFLHELDETIRSSVFK